MDQRTAPTSLIDDVLGDGLRVVFCGTALGNTSAKAGAYYAHPRNLFWPTLHTVGLTQGPGPLAPARFKDVLGFGIGLTDLCKHYSGNDNELPANAFDNAALAAKIMRYRPRILAFTSKAGGRAYCGHKAALGWQDLTIGATRLYILPSTSPNARWQWETHKWHWDALAAAAAPSL